MTNVIKTKEEIEKIRESCRIVADVLKLMKTAIRPGVTTRELDTLAEEYIYSQNAEPAFKGYGHEKNNLYPASICASVDDQVVHGIPGSYRLREGDIISVDVGAKKNGYYGDGAWTFEVGKVTEDKLRLMKITEESLYKGIEQAKPGNRVKDISSAVQTHVERAGFSVVRDLVGHGVGRELHEDPAIPNFVGRDSSPKLESGMTLAIEPMVNYGTYRVRIHDDGWTVSTQDGLPSAHFEHTVLVTENGPKILTQ